MTSQQPAVSFSLGPPNVPFSINVEDSKLFAFVISLYPNSSVSVADQPLNSNFGMGLDIKPFCPGAGRPCVDSFNVSLVS